MKDRDALTKKLGALVAAEEKLKRQRSQEAVRGYPWIEVVKGADCDQAIPPKGDVRVKNGKRALNRDICAGKGEVRRMMRLQL